MKLKVFRYDPDTGQRRYEVFDVQIQPGMSVLGALFYIRERLDDSLSFRYSCRGAVCGTCAMLINKVPNKVARILKRLNKSILGKSGSKLFMLLSCLPMRLIKENEYALIENLQSNYLHFDSPIYYQNSRLC